MNSDWETAMAFVFKIERSDELENNPKDPGGLTKFGISQKAYPSLDIASLTKEQAKEIYKRDYWQACKCDELPSAFAIAVFDTAVNQGVGTARRILQISLDVTVDGVIGDKTIAAAHKASVYQFKKFLAERLVSYARLMDEKEHLRIFAIDWTYRVISLAELIFKLPAAA
jgi:lysozyme family protein